MKYTLPHLNEYGRIRKSHGHRGEIVIDLREEALYDIDPQFLFVEIDGIPVPFRVEELRGDYSRLICKLSRLESDKDADKYRGARLFLSDEEIPEGYVVNSVGETIDELLGYAVIHPVVGEIGNLEDIDDTTPNILLLVRDDKGVDLVLPYVEDWIQEVNDSAKTITYDCPPDLISL